jgi:23S rRNA pseudouridine1911/1915/1917 synthase
VSRLDVLYEDNHLLVINKPAGVATQGAAAGEESMVEWAREYLRVKYRKPGNVYVGIVSRLDSLVTGVLVLARTSKAAARLNEQFRTSSVRKIYWAIVERSPAEPQSELTDYLAKDDARRRVVVVSASAAGAQLARLHYRRLYSLVGGRALFEVELATGRKHQIRVQFASRGAPIVGDAKYGSSVSFPSGIALHSRRLEIEHPTLKTRLAFTAPLPESWNAVGLNENQAVKIEAGAIQ